MISVEQIRAARSLLGWNQEDLASASGLSKPAIANLERGTALPRMETLKAITKSLEDAGVEFIDGPGVKLKSETLRAQIWEGQDAIFRLWNDQLITLKNGGERLISGVNEKIPDVVAGKDRFRDTINKFHKLGIKSRILALEGDTYFVEPISHYRWVPESLFSKVQYFIYADKYAMWITEPAPKIILIENKAIADSFRKQFNFIWENNAKIPTVKTAS